jgi:hypothetical protein
VVGVVVVVVIIAAAVVAAVTRVWQRREWRGAAVHPSAAGYTASEKANKCVTYKLIIE